MRQSDPAPGLRRQPLVDQGAAAFHAPPTKELDDPSRPRTMGSSGPYAICVTCGCTKFEHYEAQVQQVPKEHEFQAAGLPPLSSSEYDRLKPGSPTGRLLAKLKFFTVGPKGGYGYLQPPDQSSDIYFGFSDVLGVQPGYNLQNFAQMLSDYKMKGHHLEYGPVEQVLKGKQSIRATRITFPRQHRIYDKPLAPGVGEAVDEDAGDQGPPKHRKTAVGSPIGRFIPGSKVVAGSGGVALPMGMAPGTIFDRSWSPIDRSQAWARFGAPNSPTRSTPMGVFMDAGTLVRANSVSDTSGDEVNPHLPQAPMSSRPAAVLRAQSEIPGFVGTRGSTSARTQPAHSPQRGRGFQRRTLVFKAKAKAAPGPADRPPVRIADSPGSQRARSQPPPERPIIARSRIHQSPHGVYRTVLDQAACDLRFATCHIRIDAPALRAAGCFLEEFLYCPGVTPCLSSALSNQCYDWGLCIS